MTFKLFIVKSQKKINSGILCNIYVVHQKWSGTSTDIKPKLIELNIEINWIESSLLP
jgi:hypothetical protein